MILKLAVVSKEINRRILMKAFVIILNCSTHERQKITLQLCNDVVVEEVVIVHSADDNFEVDFNIGSFKSSIKNTDSTGLIKYCQDANKEIIRLNDVVQNLRG